MGGNEGWEGQNTVVKKGSGKIPTPLKPNYLFLLLALKFPFCLFNQDTYLKTHAFIEASMFSIRYQNFKALFSHFSKKKSVTTLF